MSSLDFTGASEAIKGFIEEYEKLPEEVKEGVREMDPEPTADLIEWARKRGFRWDKAKERFYSGRSHSMSAKDAIRQREATERGDEVPF